MSIDLFNNISNDYVYPDLNPCPGAADGGDGSSTFEFLPNEQVGVVTGSDIVSAMGLGDISQPVSGWVQQSKTLQPGEVTFVQGLTKGIQYQTQVFLFDPSGDLYGEDHTNLVIDLSLNYYKNFRHYDVAIHAEADEDTPIDVALDIEFDTKGILIHTTYDASGITFIGNNAGYQIDITNVWGMTPDVTTGEYLILDASTSIPAFKYPNTAMLGYVLKATYPSIAEDYESYVEINHVPDYLEYFTLIEDATCAGYYERHYEKVDVGLSAKNNCMVGTMSAGDYLTYIQENNKWEKVGPLRIWISAPDPANSLVENLITGFYVFNPHDFPVKISYMIIA
jgi:hypothetical protein